MLNKEYKKFHNNLYIKKLSKLVSAKDLWTFNRDSVSKAIALGVACAWIPLPFHTIIAVFFAVLVDCNIPLVAAAIWVANPFTLPFMYYFAFHVGASILNIHQAVNHYHLSVESVLKTLHQDWEPFLLGCLVSALVSWLIAYFLVRTIWPAVNNRIQKRRARRN